LSIEVGPGSYALCLWVETEVHVQIGKAGIFDFCPGGYVYLGSAQGPGGVAARLRHHFRLAVSPRWHLDWLRPYARIVKGYVVPGHDRFECRWSKALAQLPGSGIPAAGFGASDCRMGCPSHLIYFANRTILEEVKVVLQGIANHNIQTLSTADLTVLD
jgi:Uri superfamily endonuclease